MKRSVVKLLQSFTFFPNSKNNYLYLDSLTDRFSPNDRHSLGFPPEGLENFSPSVMASAYRTYPRDTKKRRHHGNIVNAIESSNADVRKTSTASNIEFSSDMARNEDVEVCYTLYDKFCAQNPLRVRSVKSLASVFKVDKPCWCSLCKKSSYCGDMNKCAEKEIIYIGQFGMFRMCICRHYSVDTRQKKLHQKTELQTAEYTWQKATWKTM